MRVRSPTGGRPAATRRGRDSGDLLPTRFGRASSQVEGRGGATIPVLRESVSVHHPRGHLAHIPEVRSHHPRFREALLRIVSGHAAGPRGMGGHALRRGSHPRPRDRVPDTGIVRATETNRTALYRFFESIRTDATKA